MSGFEVAGIVLGAFPLAISALEHYREVAKTFGFWWEIRSEYQKGSSEVKFHRLSFQRNLKQLLLPLVADDRQIQRLLTDPGGEEWREDEIAKQLEQRLQDSYELYLEIIKQLQRSMEELNKELATEKPDFQAIVGASKTDAMASTLKLTSRRPFNKANREYEMYRLKFTFGEAKRKELFAELKDYNERLEKLLASSDSLSEVEAKRRNQAASWRTTKSSTVGQLWRHADRLYKTLNRSWSWLEHAKSAEQGYTLLFLSGTTGSTLQTWSLRETRITMRDAWVATVPILSSPPGQSTPQHRTAQPTSSAMCGRRKATQTEVRKPRPQITVTSSKLDLPKRDQGDGKHISCLCNAFASQKQPQEPYGYLRDDEKQFQVCPDTDQHVTVGNDGNIVTLDDLLRKKHKMLRNRRKRYSLALILASSFLQLHDSQWLPNAWQKGDISFLRDGRDDTLLLDRPCLTRGFARGQG